MSMQPSKQAWDDIVLQLDRQHDPVYLRCDGYLVGAVMRRVSKNSLSITVDVNGWEIKGAWLTSPRNGEPMQEEPRRFYRPKKLQRMKAKELKLWEKLNGKRECKARGYYDPIILPVPYWPRPKPFIAHLKKHNTKIEILDYKTYAECLEELRRAEGRTTISTSVKASA